MLLTKEESAKLEGFEHLTQPMNLVGATNNALDKEGAASGSFDSKSDKAEEVEKRRNIISHYLNMRNPRYCDQFKFACQLNQNIVDEKVSGGEAFFHVIALPWKMLFATTPSR
jgi:hypothetical protein